MSIISKLERSEDELRAPVGINLMTAGRQRQWEMEWFRGRSSESFGLNENREERRKMTSQQGPSSLASSRFDSSKDVYIEKVAEVKLLNYLFFMF